MTETSTTSSIISALGAGSGVDMAALASDLATAQYALRTEQLAAKSEVLEAQISAASSLKSSLSLLASAMGDRIREGDLAVTPEVANSAVATATSPSGTTGSGTYTLEVLSLASAQTLASTAFEASTTVVGAGSVTFHFGETSGSSFTEDADQAAVTIDIAEGATLSDVAKAINASGAGLTAYVATTTNGAQLVIKGETGTQNGFIVEATGAGGLAALAWDPASGGDAGLLLATAADAQFKLDGLSMSSASNSVDAVAPGLSLTLTGTNAGSPTQISFSNPVDSITSTMEDLVSAFNEIISELNTATDGLSGGALASDPGARALKRTLSGLSTMIIMPNAADGAPSTLSDLGLTIQTDGTFALDSTRLQETLDSDPAGAAAMFTTGLYGIYGTLDKIARAAATSGDPGSLAGSIARYEALAEQVSEDTAKIAEQQETLRATLVARFAKAETRIASSQSTLAFLQAQIDAWNSDDN